MDRAGRPRTGRTARPTRMGLAVEASRTHLTEDRKARAIRSSPGTWARRGPSRAGPRGIRDRRRDLSRGGAATDREAAHARAPGSRVDRGGRLDPSLGPC